MAVNDRVMSDMLRVEKIIINGDDVAPEWGRYRKIDDYERGQPLESVS